MRVRPFAVPLMMWLAAAAGGGCVRSLQPIYTDETVTYDAAFLGAWVSDDGKTRLDVSAATDDGNGAPARKAYRVAHTDDKGRTAALSGHLAKVGDLLVADLTVADDAAEGLPDSDVFRAHLLPLHSFWVVRLGDGGGGGKTLSVRTIRPEWLKKFVTDQPAAIAHHRLGDDVILTAPPEALQKFVLAHAKEMLGDEVTLRRPADEPPGAPASP